MQIDYKRFLEVEFNHCMDAVSDNQVENDPQKLPFDTLYKFYNFLSELRYSRYTSAKFDIEHFAEDIDDKFGEFQTEINNKLRGKINLFLNLNSHDYDIVGVESLIIFNFYDIVQKNLLAEINSTTDECCPTIIDIFVNKPASITESGIPALRTRLLLNKRDRYNGNERKGYWKKELDHVTERDISSLSKTIPSKVVSFLRNSDQKSTAIMIDIIILLLIKYHIILHRTSSAEYRSLHQHIKTAEEPRNEAKVKRAKNVFTFIRLIAKYFNGAFASDENESNIIAKGIELISYIRRGFAYEQLDRSSMAFNDYTSAAKCASVIRDNWSREYPENAIVLLFGKLIVPYTYALKGDIYKKEHAYYNAHQYFCGAINKFTHYQRGPNEQKIVNIIDRSIKMVRIKREKAKTFLELGELNRALKWYLKALAHLINIYIGTLTAERREEFHELLNYFEEPLFKYFEEHRHDPKVRKSCLSQKLLELINKIEKCFPLDKRNANPYAILFSDLFNRISMVLYLLRLPDHKSESYNKYAETHDALRRKKNPEAVTEDTIKNLSCHKKALVRETIPMQWVVLSLSFNPINFLAVFNKLLYEGKPSTDSDTIFMNFGGSREVIYRLISKDVLEQIANHPKDVGKPLPDIAKELFRSFLVYTDAFSTKNAELYQYLMKHRTIDKEKDDTCIYFHALQRWSSINPALPRPSALKMKGGGYFITFNGLGIAIDPGLNFIENLYSEGFSISDIDYIIATHDHIDHTADIDAIMSLHYRRCTLAKDDKLLTLIANPTVSARYSFMVNQDPKRFKKMELTPDENEREIFQGFSILSVKVDHTDIVSPKQSSSIGLKLVFKPVGKRQISIGITGDTRYSKDAETGINKLCECDILIAHINSASFRELKALCRITLTNDTLIEKMRDMERLPYLKDIIDQIKYSYGYKLSGEKSTEEDISAIFSAPKNWNEEVEKLDGQHLFLSGIHKIYHKFFVNAAPKTDKLFVIAETTEEMGTYRQKVATFINEKYEDKIKKENKSIKCVTSDIGLSIRIGWSKDKSTDNKLNLGIKCSRCSLNNDNTVNDIFHKPEDIKEVCIKREDEGIFYFCKRHDPESINRHIDKFGFIERIERYEPFKHVDISAM